MSEKRFELRKYGDSWEVYDNETFECYTIHNVSDLLNKLAEENEELGISIKLFEDDIATKDKKIEEQQATIQQLAKKWRVLSQENEQLKERLYDFEKRKIIEESEIDEDVIPKVKLLRAELFGEKYE